MGRTMMLNGVTVLDSKNDISIRIFNCMNGEKSVFIGRIGGSDTDAVKAYYDHPEFMEDNGLYAYHLARVKSFNGYFDFNDDLQNFKKYLKDMTRFYRDMDDCSYTGLVEKSIIRGDSKFYESVLKGKTLFSYGFIEGALPFLRIFKVWGEGKKILIISPLSKSIQYQFKNKDKLFYRYQYPDFELITYNTPITYNTAGDTKESLKLTTDNWHEECQRMAEDISKIDFDIALLSCASYSMFLGIYIRDALKKKAVYIGGALNTFFNIYGGRFVDYSKDVGTNLKYEIDPFENDDIADIKGGRESRTESLNAYFGKRKKT